jgi:NAD+ synthase
MEVTNEEGSSLDLNLSAVKIILVNFIKDETGAAGFKKVVIGLSGGIDSAVAAHLAVQSLGKKNVHALMLPYKTSSPESLRDAKLIASKLGIRSTIVDITPMVDPYLQKHKVIDKVRMGNVMARTRMIVLFDYSQKGGALVLGTSNKTELLLGYGTIYGDLASAINPLGDLYKTQVWNLASYLHIPENIIAKKPSADLWKGQTDEEELGFEYRHVDQLLFAHVDERKSDGDIIRMGYSKKYLESVKNKIRINQYKRRTPIIAKISFRTVNIDFRYARDWGI